MTFKSFKNAIAPGATLVHDKDNTHSILIEKLGLSSETYDANEIKLSPDKDNPLRRVNEVHARLKNFLYAHNRFNRDSVFFSSLSILETTVDSAFGAWAAPNAQLRLLCSF